jgi:predicted CoA-binding protein
MDDRDLRELLENTKTIAVVGLSPKENRPSHQVARYLQAHGYRIIPVRPGADELLGERAYPSVSDIPDELQIDVVDVFRRPEAVQKQAKALWLQEGIVNEEAARKAREGGLRVVMDRCMLKEHRRLLAPR